MVEPQHSRHSERWWVVAVVDGSVGHVLSRHMLSGCGELCRPVLNLDATMLAFTSDAGSFVLESCASRFAAFRWRRFLLAGE